MSVEILRAVQVSSYTDGDTYTNIRANLSCDTVSDLPAQAGGISGYYLVQGTTAHVIEDNTLYCLKSDGVWVLQDMASRMDVYTKTETDTQISDAIRNASAAQALIDSDQDAAIAKQLAALLWYINVGAAKNLMPTPDGTNPAGQSWFRQDITLPPGDYVVFFQTFATTDTDNTECRIGFFDAGGNAAGSYKYINVGSSHSVTNAHVVYTLENSCTNVRFYPSQTVTQSQGDTVTFTGCMICPKVLWDISEDYVPYGETNQNISAAL